MQSKRTRAIGKNTKRRTTVKKVKAQRVAVTPVARTAVLLASHRGNRIHNALVLLVAVVVLAALAGFAAWPRLSNVADPVVARIDDAAIVREIDRAIAEAGMPDDGKPLFVFSAQPAPADLEIKIDPGIAARAQAHVKALAEVKPVTATTPRTQSSRSRAHRRATHHARQNANVRRQNRPVQASQGLDAMAAVSTNELIAEARKYLGGNPTGWSSEWCGKFLDMVLRKTGHKGGGNLARGYINYGTRLPGPQVGAIAVFSRKGGGHVGIVTGIDSNGNPIIISGNHNDRVAIATYPASRALAYVRP